MIMRILYISFLLLALNSCAMWRNITGETAAQHREEERQYRQRQIALEKKASKDRDESLHPGNSIRNIKDIWGEPKRVEYQDGAYTAYYDIETIPVYMTFKNDELVAWKYDYQGAQARDSEDAQERRFQAAQAAQRDAERRQGGGNLLQNGTQSHCTTRNVNGTLYTDCN